MASPQETYQNEVVEAEIGFLQLLRLGSSGKEEFEAIRSTLESALNELNSSKEALEGERPGVLQALIKSMNNTCKVGEALLKLCNKVIETLVPISSLSNEIWESNEIKKKDFEQLIQLRKGADESMRNVCTEILRLQDALKEALVAYNQVESYFEKAKQSEKINAALRKFGKGILIFAAGGFVIACGAGVGAAVAKVVKVAIKSAVKVTTGAVVGAGVEAVAAGAVLLPQLSEELSQIRSESRSVLDGINKIQVKLTEVKKQLDAVSESIPEVTRLSESCMREINELLERIKEKEREFNEKMKLREENQQLQQENLQNQEELERLQRENDDLKAMFKSLESQAQKDN